MKRLVAPEAADDVAADVADVGDRDRPVPRRLGEIGYGDAEADVPQMPDVRRLVRVQLRVLNHHPVGLRRRGRPAVALAPLQDFADQLRGHAVAVVRDIDVAIGGLDTREPPARHHVGDDILRQRLRPGSHALVDLPLRLLFRQAVELATGGQLAGHQVPGQDPADRRGAAPGPLERQRAEVDRLGARVDPQLGEPPPASPTCPRHEPEGADTPASRQQPGLPMPPVPCAADSCLHAGSARARLTVATRLGIRSSGIRPGVDAMCAYAGTGPQKRREQGILSAKWHGTEAEA